jgi:hypothetical protein
MLSILHHGPARGIAEGVEDTVDIGFLLFMVPRLPAPLRD